MADRLNERDGLRAYQRRHLIKPPFRLSEDLVNRVDEWARAEGITPGQLAIEILEQGLRKRMSPPDAIVYRDPNGRMTIQRLEKTPPPEINLADHPV
jgi:hypothetical protein